MPDANGVTSRFIGKIAIEALAERVLEVPGANDELVDKTELDALRAYVRYGPREPIWPVTIRRIYAPEHLFHDDQSGDYQVLHEWTILRVPELEYFGIVAIFGIEYGINLGGRSVESYERWLKASAGRSPLYPAEMPKSPAVGA